MSRIRFATIRALFESFPEALQDIGAEPTDEQPCLTWLALAAGWSSGTFAPAPFPVPAYMTARAVRISLLIGMRGVDLQERPKRLQIRIAEGIRLADEMA